MMHDRSDTADDLRAPLEELPDRALQLTGADRAAMLELACREAPAPRVKQEQLLAAHARMQSLLDRPLVAQLLDLADEINPDDWRGRRIDSYEVEQHLATGGMGIVFQGRSIDSGKRVALKLMHPDLLSRKTVERFITEAEILASLRHPGIARIDALGLCQAGGQRIPYYAMELIPNAMWITAYAERYELGIRDRLMLFLQVCEAVQHGHDQGITHRDLKPANVLIDASVEPSQDPQPKIIDFGIAHSANHNLAITAFHSQQGRHVGTLQYMSPEQFDTVPIEVDERSDVYSMGLVLFELVCGRLPYDLSGCTFATAAAIVQDQPPMRPSEICASMDRKLETILLTAINKDKRCRYASIAELGRDVRLLLGGQSIQARRPGLLQQAARGLARRSRVPIAVASAVMLLAALIISFLSVEALDSHPHTVVLTPERGEANLVTLDNRILHTWEGEYPGEIRDAVLINERRANTSYGALVVIGHEGVTHGGLDGPLRVYSTQDPNGSPIWTSGVRDDELPHELIDRGFTASSFRVGSLFLFDLFPEYPGTEIVATYRNSVFSHCLVRIYGQDGTVLYQFWHDGVIIDIHWLRDAELLVFTGYNSEVYWEHRGVSATIAHYPWVVFAVRPRPGLLHSGWVTPTPIPNRVAAEWYRCIMPPDAAGALRPALEVPPGQYDPHHTAALRLTQNNINGWPISIYWVFDADGEVITRSLIISDAWRRESKMPSPEMFRLEDVPPILDQFRDVGGPGREPPPPPYHARK